MNILLIAPHLGVKRDWMYRVSIYPSITLEQITACTPTKHTVTLIDEKYDTIKFEGKYDVIGISCLTCNAHRGYEIADVFRRRGIPVVIGGVHPTALPEEAKQHADSVVLGEAESSWPRLLEDLEQKQLKPFYKNTDFVRPELIPSPKRLKRKMSASIPIQATRGCTTQCKFCAIPKIEGAHFRARPIENVIEEIKSIENKNLIFVDSSLTINPSYSKELFQEMIGLGKQFECLGNINVLSRDDELLELSKKAGCFRWFMGIESVSQKTIDSPGLE